MARIGTFRLGAGNRKAFRDALELLKSEKPKMSWRESKGIFQSSFTVIGDEDVMQVLDAITRTMNDVRP